MYIYLIMNQQKHNLDISMYSFKDILGLFDIRENDFSIENMKRAKHKVMMTHPDKSQLPAEYFIFYKKAYEILYHFFEENIKQSKQVQDEAYVPLNQSKQMQFQMNNVLQKMKSDEFHSKFNHLFDKHMTKKNDSQKNQWFHSEDSVYKESLIKGDMASAMDNMRSQNQITRYKEVKMLQGRGEQLYDEDDDNSDYIQSDPFSKLRYDDLRKVHKDETIFSVSEKDYSNIKIYGSTEQLMQERGRDIIPLEKAQSEQMIRKNYEEHKAILQQKQYNATLQTMQNDEKNRQVLSNFLLLK